MTALYAGCIQEEHSPLLSFQVWEHSLGGEKESKRFFTQGKAALQQDGLSGQWHLK